MSRHSRALGDQALHLIRDTAAVSREIDRQALRARVEAVSIRPTPGTSDLLGRPLSCTTCASIGVDGKLRAIETHDLLALAPIHLHNHKLVLDVPVVKRRRP